MFSFSNYLTKWKYHDDSNKLVITKMKNKTARIAIKEFLGLKAKIYSFLVDDSSEGKKAKGMNKNVAITSIINTKLIAAHVCWFIIALWFILWKADDSPRRRNVSHLPRASRPFVVWHDKIHCTTLDLLILSFLCIYRSYVHYRSSSYLKTGVYDYKLCLLVLLIASRRKSYWNSQSAIHYTLGALRQPSTLQFSVMFHGTQSSFLFPK